MSVFSDAIDAIFDSDVAQDAVWTAPGGSSIAIRVVPARDDDIAVLGASRIKTENRAVFDIRKSEMALPVKGHEIILDDSVFQVKSYTCRDADRLIWTVECVPA